MKIAAVLSALPALMALASLTARSPVASLPGKSDQILVIVNRDSIRTRDLDRQMILIHSGIGSEKKSEFHPDKVINKLVNDRLLIQEAKSMGMDQEAGMLKELTKKREQLAIAQYVREHYKNPTKVTAGEVEKAFDHYYRKMEIRSLARPTLEETRKLIDSVAKGAPMDTLAQNLSLDSRKIFGGLHPLGPYADIELALRNQMEKLKVGEMSPPFPYRKVYAFIRLEKSLPADPKELPAHKKNLELLLLDEKRQAAWEKFLQGIYAVYPPIVNQANLARIAKDSAKVLTAGFMAGDSAAVISIQGGGRVTDDMFRKWASREVMGIGGMREYAGLMDKAVKALSAELALKAVAKAQGYFDKPAVLAAYQQAMDSCLIDAYLGETVVKKIKFNRKEFDDYYMGHLEDFRLPDEFLLSEIDVVGKDTAEQIAARLKQGADFKYLAKQHPSEEKAVARAGEWITSRILPEEMRAKLESLKIGQNSEPLPTSGGWVILHVDNRRKGGFTPLEEADMKIREVMFQKKFAQYLDTVLATLKTNATITYRQDQIKTYFGKKN